MKPITFGPGESFAFIATIKYESPPASDGEFDALLRTVNTDCDLDDAKCVVCEQFKKLHHGQCESCWDQLDYGDE